MVISLFTQQSSSACTFDVPVKFPPGSWLVRPSHARLFSFAGQLSSKRAIANASRVLLLLQSPPCYIYTDHVISHRAGRCDRKCERRGDVTIQLAKRDRARFFPMVARGVFCREPKSKTNKKISVHVRVCESDLTLVCCSNAFDVKFCAKVRRRVFPVEVLITDHVYSPRFVPMFLEEV